MRFAEEGNKVTDGTAGMAYGGAGGRMAGGKGRTVGYPTVSWPLVVLTGVLQYPSTMTLSISPSFAAETMRIEIVGLKSPPEIILSRVHVFFMSWTRTQVMMQL